MAFSPPSAPDCTSPMALFKQDKHSRHRRRRPQSKHCTLERHVTVNQCGHSSTHVTQWWVFGFQVNISILENTHPFITAVHSQASGNPHTEKPGVLRQALRQFVIAASYLAGSSSPNLKDPCPFRNSINTVNQDLVGLTEWHDRIPLAEVFQWLSFVPIQAWTKASFIDILLICPCQLLYLLFQYNQRQKQCQKDHQ